MTEAPLPDPAVVVLAGAAGSGKSTWAAAHFRSAEIVSADALRAMVGSGSADLDASTEAFALLNRVVAARVNRSLTTVVDTLGLDRGRRLDYLRVARAAELPAILVILHTPAGVCRERNRQRDRPVPAPVVTEQLRRVRALVTTTAEEGWDRVVVLTEGSASTPVPAPAPAPPQPTTARTDLGSSSRSPGFPGVRIRPAGCATWP